MWESLREQNIRRQFTVTSWDPKSFGRPVPDYPATSNRSRIWEWMTTDVDADMVSEFQFPPQFGTTLASATDPFRSELRELLWVTAGDNKNGAPADPTAIAVFARKPQRKLSLNGVLVRDLGGRLAHSSAYAAPGRFGEHADHRLRRDGYRPDADRQSRKAGIPGPPRPAEDVPRHLVLLYTLGGGNDATNYTGSNAANALYPDTDTEATPNPNSRLRMAAQMAVNWVDALDPDDTITLFEYDTDLENGWNLDDNPYTADATTDRRTVYGVESQKLAFSESLALFVVNTKIWPPIPPTIRQPRSTTPRTATLCSWNWRTCCRRRSDSPTTTGR